MAFNLENMTVDYKKLFRMIPSDRSALAQSGAISDLISSLTPGQLVNLFPRYYRDQLPDVGKSVGSLGGALSGGTNLSGGGGQGGTSSPVTTTSAGGTPVPVKSPSAEEKAISELMQKAGISSDPEDVNTNKQYLLSAMNEGNITDPEIRAAMMAVVKGESQFKPTTENSYEGSSAGRIREVFAKTGKFNGMSDGQIDALKKNPEAFFNHVYGGRVGNAPDEGHKYRGRGFFQLTGKANYERYGNMLGIDLVSNPDLANDPQIAAKIAVAYIQDRYDSAPGNSEREKVFRAVGAAVVGTEEVKNAAYSEFLQTGEFAPDKVAQIESAATGIQNLESLQPFDPAMIGQLDQRLQKWYEKADDIQKKNFELALQKLGVEEFNETMKKQPVNDTTIQSMSTQVIEGNFIDSPAFVDQGGGVRNLPIPAHVKEKLIYAQERSGIAKVVSISSGQIPWEEAEAMGARVNEKGQWVLPNGEIVGTGAKHRHSTDVGAGDLQFYDKEGNILKNNDSRVLDFMKYSAAAGLKGIGAGTHADEYMGEYTVHVGAGEEGSWGGADPVIDAQLKAGNEMTDSDYLAWKEQKLQAALAGIEQTVAEDAVPDPVTAAQNNVVPPESQQQTPAPSPTAAVPDPVTAAQNNVQSSELQSSESPENTQPLSPVEVENTQPLSPVEVPTIDHDHDHDHDQPQPTTSAGGNTPELLPPTSAPITSPNEVTNTPVPSFSEGGTVEMPPATPGEGLAGVDVKTGEVKFMGNDRELYTQDNNGNLRIDPSTIRREDQKVEMASAEPQRAEPTNQPMQYKPQQPMPVSTPDTNFVSTMSSGSMASSPSQLRALNRAKLYGDSSGNLVNGHFS